MRISRDWATPLTIGAFGFMSVTGVLMFFHLDQGFNKLAHQWIGWVLIAGVVTHVMVNWRSFKSYFSSSNLARGIIGVCAIVLAATFISLPGKRSGPPASLP
jgi:hypothetical protein